MDHPACLMLSLLQEALGTVPKSPIVSLFGWLVADGWCWFVLREKYCWLVCCERKVPLAGG
jgi:hypothetical protein